MRQTRLFGKTRKDISKDEKSINAQLLTKAGFIEKQMAGAYNYLPLGLKVFRKIENIIREEINKIGGQEMIMPSLQAKELWERTGRWKEMKSIMYQFKDQNGSDIGLGATHEEVITDIVKKHLTSYKDLPIYLYQIQNKFRDEKRAKSGFTSLSIEKANIPLTPIKNTIGIIIINDNQRLLVKTLLSLAANTLCQLP